MTALRQPSLFEAQTQIHAPHNGTLTSVHAAISVGEHITPRQHLVLAYLAEHGPSTQDEISEGLGLRIQSVNPRVNELARMRKVVDTGMTRATSSGRQAVLWSIPAGASRSLVALEVTPGEVVMPVK